MSESQINEDIGGKAHIPTITTVRIPNMPSIYINNVGLSVSAVDIRLFVGDQVPNEDGSGITATQRLSLIMTPEVAKVVAENLVKAILKFEKEFGKLRNISQTPAPASSE